MDIAQLKKYEGLYNASKYMGSARILREYLELSENFPIPLSLAHGVDMDHCEEAMDVRAVEPIHWAFNESIYERASQIKPAVRIPHPWLLLRERAPVPQGSGVLVIGPPPGTSNDRNLLRSLKNIGVGACDVLVKHRGDEKSAASKKFWQENGINAISAGPSDTFFYDRLFDLIAGYEYVIGCTLSSAMSFAATLGKKCRLVEDFEYVLYDALATENVHKMKSGTAEALVRALSTENHAEASRIASNILGQEFLGRKHTLKDDLVAAIERITTPVHFNPRIGRLEQKVILPVSVAMQKSGLIRSGVYNYFVQKPGRRVRIVRMNEIDIWLNGLSDKNYWSEEVKYQKNVTEPGWAVD